MRLLLVNENDWSSLSVVFGDLRPCKQQLMANKARAHALMSESMSGTHKNGTENTSGWIQRECCSPAATLTAVCSEELARPGCFSGGNSIRCWHASSSQDWQAAGGRGGKGVCLLTRFTSVYFDCFVCQVEFTPTQYFPRCWAKYHLRFLQ